jgi:hypothetical protein
VEAGKADLEGVDQAMSAILHSFQIKLTPEQAAEIRREWMSRSTDGAAMVAIQPIGMTHPPGCLSGREPVLNVAIFDAELASTINFEVARHKQERPMA